MLTSKLVPRLVSQFVPRFMGLQVGLYKRNFTMDALPHDLLYKFHHTEPLRKAIPRSTGDTDTIKVDGNRYSLLYQKGNDESRIYAYVFPKSKQASGTKNLIHTANLVPWNVILTNRSTISELISKDDVSVFGEYVPVELVKSKMKSYSANFQTYTNFVNEGVPLDILSKVADNIQAQLAAPVTSSQ